LAARTSLTAPRDPVEKQQMAHFLGAPVWIKTLVRLVYACTDATAPTASGKLREAGISPQPDSAFAARWEPRSGQVESESSSSRALRFPFADPKPYFYGAIDGVTTGPFDVVLDPLRREFSYSARPK